MNKERYLNVGIVPAETGMIGIFIKTYNGLYPRKWNHLIKTQDSVDGAEQIINYIDSILKIDTLKNHVLNDVVVELPLNNDEKNQKIKDEWELIGILRFYFRKKFKGHWANNKNKELLIRLQNDKRSDYERNAEAILYAHFNEKEKDKDWICESAWGKDLNLPHRKKDNKK